MYMSAISVIQQKWYNKREIGKNVSIHQSIVNSVTFEKLYCQFPLILGHVRNMLHFNYQIDFNTKSLHLWHQH